jgi:very-short-patch-repair endonuclease
MSRKIQLPMHLLAPESGFEKAKTLRRNATGTEQLLCNELRRGQLDGLKFRRQHPIGPYIADFYCHASQLVIELDGLVHEQTEQQAYDRNRDDWMMEYGLKVLRFANTDVEQNIDEVKEKILQITKLPHGCGRPSPGPLSC